MKTLKDYLNILEARTEAEKRSQEKGARQYINTHRAATDHPRIGKRTRKNLAKHLRAIKSQAPYGNDPWGQ